MKRHSSDELLEFEPAGKLGHLAQESEETYGYGWMGARNLDPTIKRFTAGKAIKHKR